MASAVSLQSVRTALFTNHEDGIEFENLVARAEKIHQFLIDNSPHILNLSHGDRTEIHAILEKTIEELYQLSNYIDLCLFAQVSPEAVVAVTAYGIAGGTSPDVEYYAKRLDAAKCFFAGYNASTVEQQELIKALERNWTTDIEAQEKSDLLYNGIVSKCISQLESVNEQVKNSISMENKVCWIL